MKIYIDVLFFVNLMINAVILISSAGLLRIKYSPARLLLSASLGALYACVMFFPKMRIIYSFAAKVIFAMLLCFVAFAPKSIKSLVKQTLTLYAVTAAFALGVLALLYFTDIGIRLGGVMSNGIFYFNLPLKYLALSCVISYAAVSLFKRYIKKSTFRSFTPVTVILGEKRVNLRALIDTGNMLKDPASGKSVMIAEEKSLAPLFDFDIEGIMDKADGSENLPKGFRLIPFSSIGRESGILAAFLPDRVIVDKDEKTDIITAVFCGKLSSSGDYDALLCPEDANSEKLNEGRNKKQCLT